MIDVPMRAQPDDFTCGPTSLQAVYGYFGDTLGLDDILGDIPFLEEGGTLAVHLGTDALRRGYSARLHSYNLQVFDPSWAGLSMAELDAALAARADALAGRESPTQGGRTTGTEAGAVVAAPTSKLLESIEAYRTFLQAGGVIDLTDISPSLLLGYFDRRLPVLAGLSATYLYAGPRERVEGDRLVNDAVAGEPQGHFVVLCGFEDGQVIVADPFKENPAGDHYYPVEIGRLIHAILLGVLTYDGNLLVLERPA